jgi:protein-S-isoprenylcysteine O-methyltransferase Ste14
MTDARGPGVPFPPPFLFAAGLGVAWLLETRVKRFHLTGPGESQMMETAGAFLIGVGLLLLFWSMLTFLKARTAIIPIKAATALVETGPYRVSRNPMYTAMAIAYLGGMLVLDWGWALVLFPVVIVALYHFVISREERHLRAVFGDDFTAYCRRVRRWI